ncbi:protein lap4-like [Mercenaria mercenaria]|uniref:protein lap4-like n=1 Tax=Mercenaria mercenaria TaxID=6596 RepID=UPI00234EFE50|nr:protein lap4-like [Mercenaria mercenaria]XP_053407491.1 protein lap4-like [Mercenaria mercenaria]
MTETLSQFFTWAVRDVIFFSGDVQTTTIAVAITSSLCCSIVVAVVHVIALIRPPGVKKAKSRRNLDRSRSKTSLTSKKYSPVWLSSGKVHVPCVKCGHFYADDGCRFVTCKSCCFSVLSCQVHQKKSISSTPCDNKNTEMDLSSIGMQACPERLGFIGHQLTCLNLSDNKLTELPPEIGCLRGLQVLSLQQNKLTTLPETVGSLTELAYFDISRNQFTSFPDHIHSLVQLKELHMSHNTMSQLPAGISMLGKLLVLDISHNSIVSLCEELFSLFQLKVLNLSSNHLENIPNEIGKMICLDTLDARSCNITYLPSAIGNCSNLKVLRLNDNRLSRLPSKLGQLGHLNKLELDKNNLQYLPYTLSFLHDKLSLSLNENPLLTHKEFPKFKYSPLPGPNLFPSLKEFTAREIIKKNIPSTKTLPVVLQEMLQKSGCCSACGDPVCEFYCSEVIPVNFLFGGDWVPLYKQMCSPHRPQGCG